MPTINQLVRHGRKRKRKGTHAKELAGRAHARATVLRVFTIDPRKPNSGKRLCCRVRLRTGHEVTASIPGEHSNIQEHHTVLVRPGRRPDLPGVRYRVIRGVYDARDVPNRAHARSKVGTKKRQ